MSLPADNVNLVPPPQTSACVFCGARPRGDGMHFVSFDNNVDSEPVPAGLIETVDKQAGQHVYRARDAFGRGSTTYSLELPQVCGECLEQAGALIGFGDLTTLEAERDGLRAEAERLQAERDQLAAERDEAEEALRATAAFERLLSAPAKTTKAAA